MARILRKSGKRRGGRRKINSESCGPFLIAALVICLGLACFVLDLTKPFNFWVILVTYNFSSVMALGVIVLLIYTPLAFAYAFIIFREELSQFPKLSRFRKLPSILAILVGMRKIIDVFLFIMAFTVAIYTGFLLSAMNSYPMLNTAVLPALFLFSALSAGAAANNFVSIMFFAADPRDTQSKAMQKLELPVISLEILFLILIFVELCFKGGAAAAIASLVTGIWATVFWVGGGRWLWYPLLSMMLPDSRQRSRGLAVFVRKTKK